MKIRYVGPHASGVEVMALDYEFVPRDEPIDVPDEVGAALCQQVSNWVEVQPEKAGK